MKSIKGISKAILLLFVIGQFYQLHAENRTSDSDIYLFFSGGSIYDFSTPAQLINTGTWNTEARMNVGGVDYQIRGAINGGFENSSTGGKNNSNSLYYSTAGSVSLTFERVDQEVFQFYGLWMNHENLHSPPHYEPPFVTIRYFDDNNQEITSETFQSNSTSGVVEPVKDLRVSRVTLQFSGLLNLWLDNLHVGEAAIMPASVETDGNVNTGGTFANLSGEVTNNGGGTVSERGFAWSTFSTPSIDDNKVTSGSGTGSFTTTLTGLENSTTYYVRAYAINEQGVSYGNEISFSTTDGNDPIVFHPVLDKWYDYDFGDGSSTDATNWIGYFDGFSPSDAAYKFDLTPFDDQIEEAILRLYVSGKGTGSNIFLKAWGADNDSWTETPSDFPDREYELTGELPVIDSQGWMEFDVTSFVSDQLIGNKFVSFVVSGNDNPGSHHVSTNSVNNSSNKPELSLSIAQSIPPAVTNITVHGEPADESVVFTVTFNKNVNNVSTNDFTLTESGTASGSISTISSNSGSSMEVIVDNISGTGTLRLDLNAETNITDDEGNGDGNNGYIAAFTNGTEHDVDRDPPAAPENLALDTISDSGVDNTDRITNLTELVINGTAEEWSTVRLYSNREEGEVGSTTADGDSNWSLTTDELTANETHLLTATATDVVGNVSEVSETLEIVIDTEVPVITSIIPGENAEPSDETVNFTVVFNKKLHDLQNDHFSLETTGIVDATLFTVSSTEGESVVVEVGNISGSGTLALQFDGGNVHGFEAMDTAGNLLTAYTDGEAHNVDTVPPTIEGVAFDQAAVNAANQANISFTLDDAETGTIANYTITSDGGEGEVTGTTEITHANQTISEVDLNNLPDGTLTLSLILTDAAGNNAEPVSDTIVKDTIVPEVVSVDLPEARYYVAGDELMFTVHTNKNITVDAGGGTPAIPVEIGEATQNAMYVNGSGSQELTFRYEVQAGDNAPEGIVLGQSLTTNGSSMQDATANNLNLELNGVPVSDGILVDTQAPMLVTVAPEHQETDVDFDAPLVLTFNEEITLGSGTIRLYDKNENLVHSVTVDETDHQVQLTVDNNTVTWQPAEPLEELMSYTVQIDDIAITDMAGNAYSGISDHSTWNFTITFDPVPPVFTSVPVTEIGYRAEYTYDITATLVGNLSTDISAITLPDWLEFSTEGQNDAKQTEALLSGTPEKSDVGTHHLVLRTSNEAGSTDQEFSLTVEDLYPPVVESLAPEYSETDVPRHSSLSITFDEEVVLGESGLIGLYKENDLITFWNLSDADARNTLHLSEDQKTLTFTPDILLPVYSNITVAVDEGVVVDIHGNQLEGFTKESETWVFQTADKLQQEISFTEIEDRTYGDDSFKIGPEQSTENLEVTYTSSDEEILSITGNMANILKAGSVKVSATQKGNEDVFEAEPVEQTVTIKPAKLGITAPILAFPGNHSEQMSTAPVMEWLSGNEEFNYHFQLSTGSDFQHVELDTLIEATRLQLFGLNDETEYHWRVRMADELSNSAWSESWAFHTRPAPAVQNEQVIGVQVEFGQGPAASRELSELDYRLIGIPGNNRFKLKQFFEENYGTHWRAFLDTGADTEYYDEYEPEDDRFRFEPGMGFWVLSTEELHADLQINSVEVNEKDSYTIELHPGWNIISNPHRGPVAWQDVLELNEFQGDIYGYDQQFTLADTLKPFQGYYLYNHPENPVKTLEIPYSAMEQRRNRDKSQPAMVAAVSASVPKARVHAQFKGGPDLHVELAYPAMDYSLQEETASQIRWQRYYPSLEMSRTGMLLSSDQIERGGLIRQQANYNEQGEEYELNLKGKTGQRFKWKAELKGLSSQARVLLINPVTNQSWLLADGESAELTVSEPLATYQMYVGDRNWLLDLQDEMGPRQVVLEQNYPNPFNPITNIRYSIPTQQHVRVEIYDSIGRRVQVLQDGVLQPGWHLVQFDGNNLSSGIYFYRLQSEQHLKVGSMTLIK